MTDHPKTAFIGAGSTMFMKNIVSDILQRKESSRVDTALMDIDSEGLGESEVGVRKLVRTLGAKATVETYLDQRSPMESGCRNGRISGQRQIA